MSRSSGRGTLVTPAAAGRGDSHHTLHRSTAIHVGIRSPPLHCADHLVYGNPLDTRIGCQSYPSTTSYLTETWSSASAQARHHAATPHLTHTRDTDYKFSARAAPPRCT